MNSPFTLDQALLAICAAAFVATCLFLVLSIFSRLSFRIKTRLLRLFFSFGLTAVIVGVLAHASGADSEQSPLLACAIMVTSPDLLHASR